MTVDANNNQQHSNFDFQNVEDNQNQMAVAKTTVINNVNNNHNNLINQLEKNQEIFNGKNSFFFMFISFFTLQGLESYRII